MEKPIRFTAHALERMKLRGATEQEVIDSIEAGNRREGKRGKVQTRRTFSFARLSPMNQKWYLNKTVEAVFADEENAIVVLSVKVYYH